MKSVQCSRECSGNDSHIAATLPVHCIIVSAKCTHRDLRPVSQSQEETPMNPAQAVNPNKALWEKGDFTEIAVFMRQSGEAVAESLGITPPLRVLDLGCGDGTTGVPLARLVADVAGIDIDR